MRTDDRDIILDKLPPAKLLSSDSIRPILAGIRCMHSVETIQQYVAYETKHEDRTPVQAELRMRAHEIRRSQKDESAGYIECSGSK